MTHKQLHEKDYLKKLNILEKNIEKLIFQIVRKTPDCGGETL